MLKTYICDFKIIFKMIAISNQIFNQDFVFILLLLSFLIVAILRGYYWKYARLLVLGLFAQRYSNQFLREENVFTERTNMLTFVLLIINLTILFSYFYDQQSATDFIYIAFFLLLFFLFKIIIILFLGHLFLMKDIAKLLIFFSLLFDRVLAILLFPLLVFLHYSSLAMDNIMVLAINIIVVVLLLLKTFWLWKIGAKSFGLSQFYIFLYLCAIEITPALMLAKQFAD